MRTWLRRADVAVQLRRATNGEVSAAVGDCLRFGLPTIVTALGPAADLPDDVATKVSPEIDPAGLAAAIRRLTADAEERSALTVGALAYVRDRSFEPAALRLLDAVGLSPTRP